ncbi:bacterial transcriptional regulator family protein [Mycobacterium xenopi 4042]|uniref:Bacterial transcriptional regulator family protein n=1 Tax=Mycobacterium xenopi 4042 TaxID=1299334 RepID=X7Z3M8_MYCXE|nr:bacterial transcriptional regulator family protein [Mycobacterium xenopi 4042]
MHRLLARDSEGRWRLGPAVSELAAHVDDPLLAASPAVLASLREVTGESVQLYRRDGNWRICIAALEPPAGLRDTVPVGARLPMTAGSGAKVLLAYSDTATQQAILPAAKFSERALAEVRRRGWAQSVAEREPGVASVSAPVRDSRGSVVAAISVSGPIDRLGRRPAHVGPPTYWLQRTQLPVCCERDGPDGAPAAARGLGRRPDRLTLHGNQSARADCHVGGRDRRFCRPQPHGHAGHHWSRRPAAPDRDVVRRRRRRDLAGDQGQVAESGESSARPAGQFPDRRRRYLRHAAGVSFEGVGEIVDDPETIFRVGVSVWERYTGPYTDELKPAVDQMMHKRIAVRIVTRRTRSWDHRKLGLPHMPVGGSTAPSVAAGKPAG